MFLRRLLNLDTVEMAVDVIERQNRIIEDWQVAYENQRQQMELKFVRNVRDLVEQFLIVQSEGVDVRDELINGLRDLNDHVARLEEHIR